MATKEVFEDDLRKAIREEVTQALHQHASPADTQPAPQTIRSMDEQVHTVLPFQKYCANGNCGSENKEYKPAKYKCSNCGGPLASSEEELPRRCIWGCDENAEAEEIEE